MSYGCMYVLRNVQDKKMLQSKLIGVAKGREIGIYFNPMNNLLNEHMVSVGCMDISFEVCDSMNSNVAALLLSPEGYWVDGKQAQLPLMQRLQILQDVAMASIPYAESIEMYMGEDSPFLSDYVDYQLECKDVANVLFGKYQAEDSIGEIPCIHLIVR